MATTTALEQNKQVVVAFWNQVFAGRDPAGAVSAYVGDRYTQHNPDTADGPDAFVQSMTGRLKAAPLMRADIKRVIAEGDLVLIHNHITGGSQRSRLRRFRPVPCARRQDRRALGCATARSRTARQREHDVLTCMIASCRGKGVQRRLCDSAAAESPRSGPRRPM